MKFRNSKFNLKYCKNKINKKKISIQNFKQFWKRKDNKIINWKINYKRNQM